MSTSSQVDPSTLGWVKTEIDETLKQARLALETFAGDTSDNSRIRFCITHLHQVVGTLLMVELDGAALLAKETEALAEAIYHEKIKPTEAVFEALTRGILSLPDYLARLQFGQADAPLRLLPLINELRVAHDREPLPELELFTPDLSVRPSENRDVEKLKDAEFIELAKHMRHPFQLALLNWLRDRTDKDALRKMADIVRQLQEGARVAAVEQLFWAVGGMVEAFLDDGLEATNERKKIFSRLDQYLKKLIDHDDRSSLRSSSEKLLKPILFDLGHARSRGQKVTQLKQAFALDTLMAGVGGEAEEDIEDLPTPEALQSVATALDEEIEAAQDIIAGYFDEEREDATSLEPVLPLLHKMSATLEMLGIKALKRLADELAEVCGAVMDGRIDNPNKASMPMARALLTMEQSAQEMHGSPLVWKRQVDDAVFVLQSLYSDDVEIPALEGLEVSDVALSDVEFRQLASVVGDEVRVNLNNIEEALETFAADTLRSEHLAEIPQHLSQIEGALQILGQERAAAFTGETSTHIQELLDGTMLANPAILDGLAVSVGTIGAYMEGLQYNRTGLDSLIDVAKQEMKAAVVAGPSASKNLTTLAADIRVGLEYWLGDIGNTSVRRALEQDLQALASSMASGPGARIGEQMNALLQIVDDDPGQLTDDIVDTLNQSAEKLVDLTRGGGLADAGPGTGLSGQAAVLGEAASAMEEDVDEEIMEIFVEDAKECLENIRREFPKWRKNTGNMDILTELRRNYHTLKGSGRMVGARDISELAWAVENMLNKVRGDKIEPSAAMFQLLQQVNDALPEMIVRLEGGPPASADIATLRSTADALAEGKAIASQPAPIAPAESEPRPPKPAVSEALPTLDATLLQIFTNEARGHLATLREEIDSCRNAGGCPVSANLLRATHTLRGSARSVGLQCMSRACGNMEKMLQELDAKQQMLNETYLDLLGRLHDVVGQLVTDLNEGSAETSGVQQTLDVLADEIEKELHILPDASQQDEGVEAAGQVELEQLAAPIEIIAPPSPIAPEPPAVSIAPPPAAVPPAVGDGIDPELLDIFQEEAVDLLHSVEGALQQWRVDQTDVDAVHSLKRALHTLKGGARMAGAKTMGILSHNTESLLQEVEQGRLVPDTDLLDLLDEAHDTLATMLEQVQDGRTVADVDALNARIADLISGEIPALDADFAETAPADTSVAEPVAPVENDAGTGPPAIELARVPAISLSTEDPRAIDRDAEDRRQRAETDDDRRKAERAAGDRRGKGQIRVRTDLLNEIVNYAGEVSISRARMEQQIFGFRENLGELHQNVARFRDQLRDLEIHSESQILYRTERATASVDSDFDPLEFDRFSQLQHVSRGLGESLHDLATIQINLDNFLGEAETALQQQARLNTDLQEGLMKTRMVDFSSQAARLRHIVRQTARELGKRVELEIQGAGVEIDRNVLERMIGPFEHMIRNAIDHGIEDADGRRKAHKPATGKITITTVQEGSEIVIRFTDDGAGLNINVIRQKAIERGLMAENSGFTDEEVMQFIFVSGFSTAEKVTHLSGRGVGMDVVHNEVKQLGGHMSADTQSGAGTTLVIRLPLTLSITQALMINLGDQMFAIPISSVSNIIEVPTKELDNVHIGDKPMLNYADTVYPFMHLGSRLGIKPRERSGTKVPVLLTKVGSRQFAMQVDGLASTREVVIKALGPQITELPGVAGATILGDGRVVLILDIAGLMMTEEAVPMARTTTAESTLRRPVVMVVDDSLTVRKVTSRSLQKHGMDVLVAKDGIDALEQLRGDRLPDVMLVDIEMPRMDGYELTMRIRSDSELKHIPIIIITSRSGEKHRKRAFELGVNGYMGKPYQEDDLVANIQSLLPGGSK